MISTVNKVVTAVNGRNISMKFSKLESDQWYLTVFSDASLTLRGYPARFIVQWDISFSYQRAMCQIEIRVVVC